MTYYNFFKMIENDFFIYAILLISIIVFTVMFANIIHSYVLSGRIYMAVAGSYKSGTQKLHSWEDIVGKYILEDDKHRIVDSRNYRAFLTSGQSMLLCGINDGNLLLTEKVSFLHNGQIFPCILVLKREKYKLKEARQRGDNAIYKIRRTWAKIEITDKVDDLLQIAKEIMEREDFNQIMQKAKEKKAYIEKEEMLKKLKSSYENYIKEHKGCFNKSSKNHNILISTTLYVDENEVRFSIHPAWIVEGKVVHAYDLMPKQEKRVA